MAVPQQGGGGLGDADAHKAVSLALVPDGAPDRTEGQLLPAGLAAGGVLVPGLDVVVASGVLAAAESQGVNTCLHASVFAGQSVGHVLQDSKRMS